jgi:NADH-quinone oxidoreductase subunit J
VTAETFIFAFLAILAVASGVVMITHRNPVMSALSLIANFFALAGLYLTLRAQLLAVLQIVVYTGAIMVLVVFVIMLLNLGDEERLKERTSVWKGIGLAFALGVVAELGYIIFVGAGGQLPTALAANAESIGTVEGIGEAMFGRFLLPFEMTSLLLLAAIIGAVVLAKKKS